MSRELDGEALPFVALPHAEAFLKMLGEKRN
jgi:hypothetical protein